MDTSFSVCNVSTSELFDINSWIGSFTANLFSEAIVVIILGIIVYRWIENRDRLRERKENQKVVENLIVSELNYNRDQLKKLISESPKGNLVFPGLETSVWDIIDKTEFLSFYKPENIADILNIYRRTKSINRMYDALLESSNWVVKNRMITVREEFMDPFVYRCKELLNYLDDFFGEIERRKKKKIKDEYK